MFHSRFGLVFMNAQLGQLSSSTWPSQWFRTPLAEASLTLLPAKAFLHSRKMKLCYLHSESMSSRFPLTTCHCYVFVLSTLICSSGCLVDKGVYWGVCHYPSKVWRRTSMPGINTVKICLWISRCSVRAALSHSFNSIPASKTGLFGSVSLWVSHMPPPEERSHVTVHCMIVLDWFMNHYQNVFIEWFSSILDIFTPAWIWRSAPLIVRSSFYSSWWISLTIWRQFYHFLCDYGGSLFNKKTNNPVITGITVWVWRFQICNRKRALQTSGVRWVWLLTSQGGECRSQHLGSWPIWGTNVRMSASAEVQN